MYGSNFRSASSLRGSFVDLTFLNSWSRCPFSVTTLFGTCFARREIVSPGHDRIWFLQMVRWSVDLDGLNNEAEKYSAIYV